MVKFDDTGSAPADQPSAPELGDQLKRMFGDLTAGPMPGRLVDLADRLEEAFQRGELFDCASRRPHAS